MTGYHWAEFPFILCGRRGWVSSGNSVINILAPVVQKLDDAILWINLYPVDNTTGFFFNIYPLDIDLSCGWRYPTYEETGPGLV